MWLCICLFGSLVVIFSVFTLYFYADAFIFALLYIWCKRRPFETIQVMFGFTFKSKNLFNSGGYFPWIYMAYQVLMGGSFITYAIGLVLGHLYIAIKDIYLPRYHKDFLSTPQFLY